MRANWALIFFKRHICTIRSHRVGCIRIVDATWLLLLRHLLYGESGRCQWIHLALHDFLVLHGCGSLQRLELLLLDAAAVNHRLKCLQLLLLLLGLVLSVGLQLDGLLVLLRYHQVVHAEAVRRVA